jgi:hypothetical protein
MRIIRFEQPFGRGKEVEEVLVIEVALFPVVVVLVRDLGLLPNLAPVIHLILQTLSLLGVTSIQPSPLVTIKLCLMYLKQV